MAEKVEDVALDARALPSTSRSPVATRRRILAGLVSAPFVLRAADAQSQNSGSIPSKSTINMHNAPPWVARNYAVGQRVISGGNAYECVTAGVSSTPPMGTGFRAEESGVTWKYLSGVDFTDIRSMIAYFNRFANGEAKGPWTHPVTVQFWNDAEWIWNPGGEEGKLGKNAHNGGRPLGSSAVNKLMITAAPGESFRDRPDVRTAPLRYDPSRGAAINGGSASAFNVIHLEQDFVDIAGLQFKSTERFAIEGDQASFNFIIDGCILSGACWFISGDYTIRNCLVRGGVTSSYGLRCYNNTIVGGAQPINAQFNEHEKIIRNCLVYGVGAGPMYNPSGSHQISASHCQTDMASPPGGFASAGTAADQFVNPTSDFRLKPGARAIGEGAADSSNGATDISGRRRLLSGKCDIGCWQS